MLRVLAGAAAGGGVGGADGGGVGAGSAIGGARKVYKNTEANAPMRRNATLDNVGGAALYLCSDMGAGTTGEVLFVDCGYHAIGMAQPANL